MNLASFLEWKKTAQHLTADRVRFMTAALAALSFPGPMAVQHEKEAVRLYWELAERHGRDTANEVAKTVGWNYVKRDLTIS